jgi:D-serine deaminase-like pyridoxal phosphate-dependent protein
VEGIEYVPGGDEHGKLMIHPSADAKQVESLQLGAKVTLAPDHCDPTVNLYDFIVAVRKGRVEAIWPIAARGPGI